MRLSVNKLFALAEIKSTNQITKSISDTALSDYQAHIDELYHPQTPPTLSQG